MRSSIERRLATAPAPLQHAAVQSWRRVKRVRREAAERLGSARYSRPALYEMDRKLVTYLPPSGVFVEAGANDGVQQSNTYYLKRFGGWTGYLIEPVPALAERARRQRSSPVINAALVAPSYSAPTVRLRASGLTSLIAGTLTDHRPDFGSRPEVIDVPARTLSSISMSRARR